MVYNYKTVNILCDSIELEEQGVEVWEKMKECGNITPRSLQCYFRVPTILHKCFYNPMRTQKNVFYFLRRCYLEIASIY